MKVKLINALHFHFGYLIKMKEKAMNRKFFHCKLFYDWLMSECKFIFFPILTCFGKNANTSMNKPIYKINLKNFVLYLFLIIMG